MDADTHAQIIRLLDEVPDMAVATIRADGFPQATVVSFVHDDLRLYFGTGAASQKARNIAACDKVSCTVTHPYRDWDEIEGLSLGGRAARVTDADEARRAGELLMARFPQAADYGSADLGEMVLIRIDPVVISLLDYTRGFGHTENYDVQARLSGG